MVAVYWVARIDMFMRLPIAVFFLKSAVDMLVMYDLWIIVGTFAR